MLKIDKRVAKPQSLDQFVSGNQLTGIFEQGGQDKKRLFAQVDGLAISRQLSSAKIELELSKTAAFRNLSQGAPGYLSAGGYNLRGSLALS